jgi:putative PIN family toxin of toxin-antitoxin system
VLNYKKLALTEIQQQTLLAEFDSLIHVIPDDEPSISLAIKLPICRDKDDQKFLVLAHTAQADFLITKDKALLKLARKTSRLGLFTIASPEAWTKHFEASA